MDIHPHTITPEMLMEVLGDWEKFIHAEDDLPDLIRLAMIHYQFEAIHPFIDGNGRIGRLLIVLLLCTWGLLPQPLLYLSAFFERYRDDYYRLLLKVSQQGAWEDWIELFLRGVRTQAIDALLVGNNLLALQQQYHALFAIKPPTRILHHVIDRLLMNPVMSIPTLRDACQVDFRTAKKTIAALVQAGIAREVTGQQRNRLWVATDILQLISEKRVDSAQP